MEQTDWVKICDGSKMPEQKKAVRIFVQDKDGGFNVFWAHHEERVWFVYDPFKFKFRIYPRQQYVTHWKNIDDLPAGFNT